MKVYVTASQVAGSVANWAIQQSPYSCPDNLETVVRKFTDLWLGELAEFQSFGSEEALEIAIREVSQQIPELLAWNTPKSGHDAPFVFVSRYDGPSPDDDFIDLHALWRNAARAVWSEEMALQ